MAGGTWTAQNKVRPGVYIDFVSEAKPKGDVGERGIVALALPLSWGESKKITALQAGDDLQQSFGYGIGSPETRLVQEALKRAKTVLLYRLNGGAKAAATLGALSVLAKHGGTRGNAIQVAVLQSLEGAGKFDVKTFVDGRLVDQQTAEKAEDVDDNDWVAFSGAGALTAAAGTILAGGTDEAVTNQDHVDFLAAAELHDFQTMALVSTDTSLKEVYAAFAKRLRDDEGRKIQIVLENAANADYEGIISVKNGVRLADGTLLSAAQATVWTAAATAGAQANQSLTYAAYDGAVDANPRYSSAQIEAALRNGEIVFVHNNGRALVEQDINTFKSFAPERGKSFSKNRVIRVLDSLANDWKRIYETSYIGKVNNNADGRALFKQACVAQAEVYLQMGALQNFNAQTDITVSPGADSDAILVEAALQPVDAIEKIYMKVTVK